MPDPANADSLRQQVLEMTAPARRVVAGSVSARRRPIEDAFDTTAHAASGFWLFGPDRLDRLENQTNIYRLHGQRAKCRVGVSFER